MRKITLLRFWIGLVVSMVLLGLPEQAMGDEQALEEASAERIAALSERAERVIERAKARELTSQANTPWVVMHAAIPFADQITVRDVQAGDDVPAMEFLRTRAEHDGELIYHDDDGQPLLATRGLRYGMTDSFIVQDHVDQFLFLYALHDVPRDALILAQGGAQYTVGDAVEASKANMRLGQEWAWTLIVMDVYEQRGATWENDLGETFSVERLMELAVQRNPNRETEGGTHHMYGIAWVLNRHIEAGGELEGAWADARTYLDEHVQIARRHQQTNGEFSPAMFRAGTRSNSPSMLVWATGHTLEWLAEAMEPEGLKQRWVVDGVEKLIEVMEEHEVDDFSDGGLYHAVHALQMWRERAAS